MIQLRQVRGNPNGQFRKGDAVSVFIDGKAVTFIARRATTEAPGPGKPDLWCASVTKDSVWESLDGKDGPPGPPGRDGAPGSKGVDGLPGSGFQWRGEYRRTQTYKLNDVVEHSGSSWVCNKPTSSVPSEASRSWSLMAKRGATGARGQDGLSGGRGRPGADGATVVVESGSAPVAAIFDSITVRGDVLYVSSGGHVDLAQADGEPQALAVGIALESVSAGQAGAYRTNGVVSNPGWSLVPGAVYYLSPSVAGGMTDAFPNSVGDHVVILGAALSATELNLNIHWALVIGS